MHHPSLFFRLFPPPKFLISPHAGLDISDDAIRMLEYGRTQKGLAVSKYDKEDIPAGLIDGGDFRDEKKFTELLSDFVRRNRLSHVKVSLPEEKVYLFQTDIPSTSTREITQNIEFKLEENVPLAAQDAVFYFDVLPRSVTGGALRASVSVAPKTYVENLIATLRSVGLTPVAFEVAPKSIAKAAVSADSEETSLVTHFMDKKTGIYIISGGVVCFSSTIGMSYNSEKGAEDAGTLVKELNRVLAYWATRPDTHSNITEAIFVGRNAGLALQALKAHSIDGISSVSLARVWGNVFDVESYVPPIESDESLEYAVAAGLALPL